LFIVFIVFIVIIVFIVFIQTFIYYKLRTETNIRTN